MILKNRVLLFISLSVLIFLLLAFIFLITLRDVVRETFLVPASYLWWVAAYLYRSTPQMVYWIIFIIIGLIYVANAMFAAARHERPSLDSRVRYSRRDRVNFWLIQLLYYRQGYSRTRFSEFFSRLATDVLTFREQCGPVEVDERLVSGQIAVSPEALPLLRGRRVIPATPKESFFARIARALREIKGGIVGEPGSPQGEEQNRQIEQAILFLEDQLEVKHDH